MDITYKAVSATITDTSSNAEEFPGTFEVELSNETTDRDGDTLKASDWETPLPEQITFVNDHTHKMASVVGSAKPTLVGDKILCKGVWGKTQVAQDTRLIAPHVPYVSVAYAEKSNGKRELINGAFVVVPSNPTARLLASKSVAELDDDTLVSDLTVKQLREMYSETANVIGDAEGFTFDTARNGLTFAVDTKSSTVEVKQHGNLLGTHKFSQQAPEVAPVITTADHSADPLGEKAAAQALAAANQMASQLLSEQD